MGAIIGAVVRWLGLASIAKWLAWKTVISALIMSVLGVVFYNLVCEVVGEVLQVVADHIASVTSEGLTSAPLEFAGLGAWLAVHLKIPEQVGVMVAMVGLKWLVVLQ